MLKFDAVTKKFPNGTIAFKKLSFEVDKGDLVLITGPSGSGKTTIMKLLIKEYDTTAGKILLEKQPLDKIKNRKIPQHRQKIGVVFQDYKLIEDLNVWENIALPLYIKKESQKTIESRVTDLLKLVGLSKKALLFPKQLSGGEAQRVSIARALSTGPNLLFADEPTGNLDANTSLKIIDLLSKINKLGTTVLLASHDSLVLEKISGKRVDLTRHQTSKKKSSKTKKKTTKKKKKSSWLNKIFGKKNKSKKS
jgi:cell division transport system ATP-binding protein